MDTKVDRIEDSQQAIMPSGDTRKNETQTVKLNIDKPISKSVESSNAQITSNDIRSEWMPQDKDLNESAIPSITEKAEQSVEKVQEAMIRESESHQSEHSCPESMEEIISSSRHIDKDRVEESTSSLMLEKGRDYLGNSLEKLDIIESDHSSSEKELCKLFNPEIPLRNSSSTLKELDPANWSALRQSLIDQIKDKVNEIFDAMINGRPSANHTKEQDMNKVVEKSSYSREMARQVTNKYEERTVSRLEEEVQPKTKDTERKNFEVRMCTIEDCAFIQPVTTGNGFARHFKMYHKKQFMDPEWGAYYMPRVLNPAEYQEKKAKWEESLRKTSSVKKSSSIRGRKRSMKASPLEAEEISSAKRKRNEDHPQDGAE